jgi:hypothetical protein
VSDQIKLVISKKKSLIVVTIRVIDWLLLFGLILSLDISVMDAFVLY